MKRFGGIKTWSPISVANIARPEIIAYFETNLSVVATVQHSP